MRAPEAMRGALLALALLLPPPALAAGLDVASLFDLLAKQRPGRATFQERKHVSLLDRPVDSSGELVFTPPDKLEKRTLLPRPERVVVDGQTIVLERGGKRHTLGLRDNPAVGLLVESIRATLAGDLAAVSRTYSAAVDGDAARWRLVLRPLDASAATLVERIEIRGASAQVRTVEIFQGDGDRSVMTITPAP